MPINATFVQCTARQRASLERERGASGVSALYALRRLLGRARTTVRCTRQQEEAATNIVYIQQRRASPRRAHAGGGQAEERTRNNSIATKKVQLLFEACLIFLYSYASIDRKSNRQFTIEI